MVIAKVNPVYCATNLLCSFTQLSSTKTIHIWRLLCNCMYCW